MPTLFIRPLFISVILDKCVCVDRDLVFYYPAKHHYSIKPTSLNQRGGGGVQPVRILTHNVCISSKDFFSNLGLALRIFIPMFFGPCVFSDSRLTCSRSKPLLWSSCFVLFYKYKIYVCVHAHLRPTKKT